MKKFFIVCAMILLYHAVNAQNRINGKVTDLNNSPIPGATVFLPEINKGTISDESGAYEFDNLPNGNITLQFSYIGYTNITKKVILAGKTITLDVKLQYTAIESEEIVITGGFSSTQHENVVKIEKLMINPFELKATPNFTEMLSKIPGVDMISKGSGVSKPVIRGLSMNDILVLNNGVRFENYQYSSHHPLGIDEFGIDEVEIIKGPASLLYGSDAIGGVINFIKEKPAPIGIIMGDYNMQLFSNTLGMTNNLGIKGTSEKMFAGIRVGHKTNSDFLQGGGKFVPNSRFNELSLKSNLGFTTKAGTFKLYFDHNKQNLGLVEAEAFGEINEQGRETKIFYQQLNTNLLSSQNKLYFGKMKVDVNAAFQNTGLIHVGEVDMIEIQMNMSTITYETKLHLPVGLRSEYIFGFQGMNQTNTNMNNRETKLLPDATINNASVFGVLQQTISSKLTLQTGIRYDSKSLTTIELGEANANDYRPALDKKYGSFSGSAGVTYNVNEKLLVRTNIAAAYRTPNLAELTSNGQHETRYEVGDENLKPENTLEFDMSLHYHIDNLTIDLAGFYNSINHYIFIDPTGDTTTSGIPVYKYRQQDATIYGGEAGIHFHPVALSWMHIATTFATVTGIQKDADYLPFIPANKLNFEISAQKKDLSFMHDAVISLNLNTAFKQNHPAIDESSTDSYSLFDISIGAKIKVVNQYISIGLSTTNLFDVKYIDHLSTLKEVYLNNQGRSFNVSLKVPIEVYNRTNHMN